MEDRRIVAIHQPNFFPWLGFFDKIHRSDLFVYLDHVENNPRDSLWTKRVKIIVSKREYWLTIPLIRSKSSIFQRINEMKIRDMKIKRKHLPTIKQSYGKAPFFNDVFPLVMAFYESSDPSIANRNIIFIDSVCEKLDIYTPKSRTSHYEWNEKSTDLLVEILTHFNGTGYLCGGGAADYQEDDKFERSGFDLIYQDFRHPTYPQFNSDSFVPGLSILDILMNCGFEGTKQLLKKSY